VSDTARVFFALWPDEAIRQRLDAAAARLHRLRGGRQTRAESIHLTLVFLGDVPRTQLPALLDCAAAVQAPPFEIVFDLDECWRHNRIGFLTAGQIPAELTALVDGLEQALAQSGAAFDRRPYKPHITLLRHADCRKEIAQGTSHPRVEPVVWPAREFVLVESRLGQAGSTYVPIRRFPLL